VPLEICIPLKYNGTQFIEVLPWLMIKVENLCHHMFHTVHSEILLMDYNKECQLELTVAIGETDGLAAMEPSL